MRQNKVGWHNDTVLVGNRYRVRKNTKECDRMKYNETKWDHVRQNESIHDRLRGTDILKETEWEFKVCKSYMQFEGRKNC